MRRADRAVPLALAAALGLFALTFRGDRARFWERMTLTGFVLGMLAVAEEPDARLVRRLAEELEGLRRERAAPRASSY